MSERRLFSGIRGQRLLICAIVAPLLLDMTGLVSLVTLLLPLVDGTAIVTTALLHAVGFDVARDQGLIYLDGGFAFRIDFRCTGIWPVVILGSLLVAEPMRPVPRLASMVLGVCTLLAINQLRLVSLFWMGVYRPDWFGIAHDLVWPTITVCVIAALWLSLRSRTAAQLPVEREVRLSANPLTPHS